MECWDTSILWLTLKRSLCRIFRIGAERAGRSLQNLDIACGLPTIITDDDSGLQLNKGQILMFTTASGSSPFYLESLARAGFGDKASEVQKRFDRKDLKGALQVITEEMVDAFTISGTADPLKGALTNISKQGPTWWSSIHHLQGFTFRSTRGISQKEQRFHHVLSLIIYRSSNG